MRMIGTGAVTGVLLSVAALAHFVNSFQLNLLDYATDIQDGENPEGGIPSSNYCSDNYPYTFSKCLRLCSTDLDVTCLDDQLCYCNSEIARSNVFKESAANVDQVPSSSLNAHLGLKPKVSCQFSDFCEDLCRYDERLFELVMESRGSLKVTGALCKLPEGDGDGGEEIESCVCAL